MAKTMTPEQFGWIVDDWAKKSPDVMRALLVSSDGLLLHRAGDMDQEAAETLSAITSLLLGAGRSIGELVDEAGCGQIHLRFPGCSFVFMAIEDRAGLAVLTRKGAAVNVIVDRMAHLIERAGRVLTPQLRDAMHPRLLAPGAGS